VGHGDSFRIKPDAGNFIKIFGLIESNNGLHGSSITDSPRERVRRASLNGIVDESFEHKGTKSPRLEGKNFVSW
jgi:hypothetical protein